MRTRSLFVAAFAFLGACASTQAGQQATAETPTTIRVENQGFPDMTIYAVRGSQRMRLGIAPGHNTTNLTVPRTLMSGLTPLRFIADPIAGNRPSVSQEITVAPGDAVTLTIPPN
jgi:hypothetical protein